MPNATRITNTGNLLVNGTFDEFTGAPVINSNVVLWLDAAQTSSYSGTGNTWTDLSTNALNGTLVNSPTFSTSPANILFNGTSQRVTFSANSAVQFLNTAPYTLEAWIYPTQIPPSSVYQGIIDRESNPGTGRDGWTFWLQGNSQASTTSLLFGAERFGLGVQNGVSISVTAASTVGVWQHMISTYDGSTLKIYRNGVQLTSGAATANITNTTQTVGFASRGGAGSFFYGSISAAKIYNRALSDAEILQNYNALAGRYGLAANTSGTAIQRTTSTTVLAEQFDEVTYNTASPTIKNNFIYSQNQSNVAWVTQNSVVTANAAIAPDGTLTASKLVGNNGVTGRKSVYQNKTITANTNYTYSVYLKKAEFDSATIWFDVPGTTPFAYQGSASLANLTLGTVSGSQTSITNVGNGWYRCATTASSNVSSVNFQVSQGDPNGVGTPAGNGTSGIFIWGEQLELGNTATIYQPIAAANTLVTTGMAQRVDNGGNMYVSNIFDEFTGAPVADSSLLLWADAAQPGSYPGTGTTWTDLSVNTNNATLSTVTFNNDQFGGRMTFNGSSSAASLVTSKFNTPYTGKTVFVVARMNSAGWTAGVATYRAMFGSGDVNRNFNFYVFKNSSDTFQLHFSTPGAATQTGVLAGLTNDTWFIAAVTNSSTAATYYLNGSSVYTTAATLSQYLTTTAEYIGRADNYWYGDIAQVMVYSRALSADEISDNYNALKRRYGLS